ncbi:hypothetical protein L1987_14406 [Smallanthus sonchifolius]|uniref:Uncharacterized protein n=1 Tax=Smallanthus sonchifolius TaxID=185202 RepID=A0ACB9J356_9ASTR|nr:hypothetical protein L1987_14406 [Smallanthus sonchifolius]
MIVPKTPPSAILWNTLEFLEPSALTQIRDHYQVPIFTVGPLHKIIPTPSTSFLEEDTSCIPWLDKQAPRSVIYVSLGSIANVDEKVSTEIAWGLANSKQPFLWVVRPGSVRGFEWIEFLPEGLVSEMKVRGLIVKWAPQKEVLAHSAVGGFWSHCGWNSALESMFEGVPMLCQPFELDQKVNSRYLSYVWKMGVEVVVERGEIEGAIRRVLVGKEGEEMKQRAMEIQEKNGHDMVVSMLVEAGAFLDMANARNRLCMAVAKGDVEFFKRVLDNGINPNSRNYDLRTPPHIAATEGLYSMAKVFYCFKILVL